MITFTGVDERTNLNKLYVAYDIEYGLLVSDSRMKSDYHNRYPKLTSLRLIATKLPNVSIHLCGMTAKELGVEESPRSEIRMLLSQASRIQLNGSVTPKSLELYCKTYPDKKIITQLKYSEKLIDCPYINHQILVDDSGGLGILPSTWNTIKINKVVGYAGGLTPDNVRDQIHLIGRDKFFTYKEELVVGQRGSTYRQVSVEESDTWIDAESGLRTNDWFDYTKAHRMYSEYRRALSETVSVNS